MMPLFEPFWKNFSHSLDACFQFHHHLLHLYQKSYVKEQLFVGFQHPNVQQIPGIYVLKNIQPDSKIVLGVSLNF